jgi:C4-dicarboxylate transporter, DctQ subunit
MDTMPSSAPHTHYLFEEWVAALAMLLMLLLVVGEILLRDLFNTSNLWSEEVARYLMIWSVYFGSAAAVARGAHLRIEMLIDAVSLRVRRILDIVATTWVLAFGLAMTWAGYMYVRDSFTLGFVSADSNLPLQIGWVQLVGPITFALTAIHAIRQLFRLVAQVQGRSPGH